MTRHETNHEQARALAEAHVEGSAVARDLAASWDPRLFRRLGAAGLLGLAVPHRHGGPDQPAQALCAALAGFGAGGGDAGLALSWAAHTLGCLAPLARLGSHAQRQRHLPGLRAGERVGAWAHDDHPDAPVHARPFADGWRLDGRKLRVVNAPVAGLFVVTAITGPTRSAFLVERHAPGLSIGPRMATSGMRTATISALVLEGCQVDPQALLGAEGAGLAASRLVHRWERACILAPWLGLLRGALDRSLAHARQHREYGLSLAQSQALRARLADMRIRLDLCERLLARAAWQLDHPEQGTDRDLAIARLFVGDGVHALVHAAAELCAPHSLELGHPLERLVRDHALVGLLGLRGDVLRSVIAGSLLGLG